MKYSLLVLCLFLQVTAFAKTQQIGAGAGIGSVTILSGEFIQNETKSFDGGLAFDLGADKKLYLHGSMLFHFPNSLKLLGQIYNWYYGLGARYLTFEKNKNDDEYRFGPRASAGLDYRFQQVPIKLFAEAAFIMNIAPSTSADLDVIFGGRYYF